VVGKIVDVRRGHPGEAVGDVGSPRQCAWLIDFGLRKEGALASSSANRQRGGMIYPGLGPRRVKPYFLLVCS
jgi:hypothetical protein